MIDNSPISPYYGGMIGEHLFTFEDFGISATQEGADDLLYRRVHLHRKEMQYQNPHYRYSGVWPRHRDYFYTVYPRGFGGAVGDWISNTEVANGLNLFSN